MTNLELEKIQRTLYKQEQQKKAENKIKYPFIYDHSSNKNIKNFFEFDKITSNPPSPSTSYFSDKEIKNSLNKENKINYDINSFTDNEKIPDLYTPLGKISGDNYNLIKKENLQLDCLNQEDDINNNEKRIISKKRLRYFNLDFDLDIPEIIIKKLPNPKIKNSKRKSYINNNNTSKSNFIYQHFCYICLSKEHLYKKECPKYKRCYKCLQYGHWAKNCEEILKDKCENCHMSVHKKEDCLKYRDEIKYEDLFLDIKKNGLKCAFCEQSSHLICPFSTREKYILKYENEKNNNKVKNNENINDFSKILFCPFCAGNHLKKECPEINKNKNNSILSEKNYLSNLSSNFSSSKEQSFDSLDINNSFNKNSLNEELDIKNDNNSDINMNNYENYKKDATKNNGKNDIINIKFTQKNKIMQKNNNFNNAKDTIKKDKVKLFYNKPNNNNYYRNRQYGKNHYQNNQNNNNKKTGSLFEHYLAYKNRNTSS